MIRVLIADDHEVVRDGLKLILETEDDFEVVGEAGDGSTAVELTEQLQPDVVLMDLRMPGIDGLQAIEKIHSTFPKIAVVILTTYNEDDLMIRGLRAGARGYLLKDTNRQMLFDSLRAASRGEALFLPEVIDRVMKKPTQEQRRVNPILTEREIEVLQEAAKGERSKEIAVHLGIAERTVKAHLDSIYSKLGVDSRAAAVATAIARGLIPSPIRLES